MNKKILIGSIIAVVILLLMPSISAIQQRAIKDRAYDDLFEQLDDVDFKDVKEINTLDLGERVKHPLLYIFVFTLGAIRGIRGFYSCGFSSAGLTLSLQTTQYSQPQL